MSKIHEALKRAEQEKDSGQIAQESVPGTRRGIADGAIESASRPRVSRIEAEPVSGSLQFEELWEKCSQGKWNPDSSMVVFANSNPSFPGTEQFRTLRTRLYRIRESQPLQTILISSAIPAEGKTVIATNLAYALVRQRGCRVLLIDADLRSPRAHALLGAPAAPGLADYLQNSVTEFEATHHGTEEGLCFIPAGNNVTHPSELISSDRMKQLLDRVRHAFDWIIIDSPPALPVADANVLGGLVDGVLLVVRANSTPSEASQKACKELGGAPILGVVLNIVKVSAGYNSYYSNGVYGYSQIGVKN